MIKKFLKKPLKLIKLKKRDCKGKLTKAWGLGGLLKAHSRLG